VYYNKVLKQTHEKIWESDYKKDKKMINKLIEKYEKQKN